MSSSLPDEMSETDRLVNTAVHLSLVEIVLGSLLHAFNVPLAGHFLSLNQGAFLCRALSGGKSRFANAQTALEISVIASLMKSFSPAGKKLGPMMSISCQGGLFSLGILVAGSGLAGQILGMIALSIWAFLQPLVTYYLIYGNDLFGAIQYFSEKLTAQFPRADLALLWLVGLAVGIKCLTAGFVPWLVRAFGKERWQKLDEKILEMGKKSVLAKRQEGLSVWQGVLKDLTQPLFVFSVILVPLYLFLTGTEAARVLWYVLRFLSTAVLLFYFVRSRHVKNIGAWLARRSPYFRRLYELSGQGLRRLQAVLKEK